MCIQRSNNNYVPLLLWDNGVTRGTEPIANVKYTK